MNLHLHIGPGNHEEILLNQLKEEKIPHSYSHHFPNYKYTKDGLEVGSFYYDNFKRLSWGIGNKIGIRKNRLIDFTYPEYDKITSRKIDKNQLFFGWAQVSQHCFEKVKNHGINVLDYPIPHPLTWKKLLTEERSLTGETPHSLFSKMMTNRMLSEIELADFISIPSEFVKRSFVENGVDANKLILNPYGIPSKLFSPSKKKTTDKKLRVVFVGSIEIRKGIHYLLEAFSKLDPSLYDLQLVGGIHPDFHSFHKQFINLSHIHFLGPQSKMDVANIMQQSDVMVMPSILEGLSLTILEAMSCGLPVISTYNAGGLGVIEEEVDGFLIEIRNSEAIISKLSWCSANKEKLSEMGEIAREKIISYYDEKLYGDRFKEKILTLNKP